jgi:hypothetical protein
MTALLPRGTQAVISFAGCDGVAANATAPPAITSPVAAPTTVQRLVRFQAVMTNCIRRIRGRCRYSLWQPVLRHRAPGEAPQTPECLPGNRCIPAFVKSDD